LSARSFGKPLFAKGEYEDKENEHKWNIVCFAEEALSVMLYMPPLPKGEA